ncbi:MAG: aminoglycoside phosphotransferase family protein [Clostridia bacterium]|nr:aminoglycoside phosphotransferase family protein [Clostridia bacterium]
MTEEIREILAHFALAAEPVSCESCGCGHINRTYLVQDASGRKYILQKINHNTFRDVPKLMDNFQRITAHLRRKTSDPRAVLILVPAKDGSPYYQNETGFWRVTDFVENSICLQQPESPADFYESARGFGAFQQMLSDFPAQTLHETIPNFHNTPDRYRIFREVLKKDPVGRAASVQKEIEFYLACEQEMAQLQSMMRSGELPVRVTHNDTKLNNVLLDANTRKALCVIDLDTVMPGLSLYDYGDSIRFGAATAAEDEKDLSKVRMDAELFAIYTKGFLETCPGLSDTEIGMMPMGAKTMTLECGLRFLTDYLDGDHYFAVSRPDQNLDRSRTHIKLVQDMEEKWLQMENIVQEEKSRLR